jgi:hypothetical protein
MAVKFIRAHHGKWHNAVAVPGRQPDEAQSLLPLQGIAVCFSFGSFVATLISPPSTKAITEGVVRLPSAFGITTGSFPSITETHEFVVPKSIPIILLMMFSNIFNTIVKHCAMIKKLTA